MNHALTEPESTVAIRIVRSLITFAQGAGVSRTALLQGFYLADEQEYAAEDVRVSSPVFLALCERALALSGDPALALHWHEATAIGAAYAPLSTMTAYASTLGEAFSLLRRYGALLCDPGPFQQIVRGDSVAIRLTLQERVSERARRFVAEFAMLGLHRLILNFAPRALPRVSFAHPAPEHRAEYRRLFGMNTHFDQPKTELVIGRALLEASGSHRDDDLLHALRQLADRRLLRLAASVPFAVRVRDLLVLKGAQRLGMGEVARLLGLSARTLRRRLESEGVGYHQIVLEARSIVAGRLLRDDNLTIQQTAHEMGFADASAFHRAFKRWTGSTPSTYRMQP